MKYFSVAQNSTALLRGPRGRSRSVLAVNGTHIPSQRRRTGKAHTPPQLTGRSSNTQIVYRAVPVSRLAG